MKVYQNLTRDQVIGYGGRPPRYSDSWIYESKQTADDVHAAIDGIRASLDRLPPRTPHKRVDWHERVVRCRETPKVNRLDARFSG